MANDVEIITDHPSNPKIAARLCNFVNNSTALLQSHNLWLEANVAPIIRSQQNSWVDLHGYASKLGNAKSNEILSANRCQSVRTKVSTFANRVNFNIGTAKGESESLGDDYDTDPVVAGYWRRVEILVFAVQPPPITRISAPVPALQVRRITHRSFVKFKTKNIRDDIDPGKDITNSIKDFVLGLVSPNRHWETNISPTAELHQFRLVFA